MAKKTKSKEVRISIAHPTREEPSAEFKAQMGRGRVKGVRNKLTREVKEVISQVFEDIGGINAFGKWAQAEKTEFYKMYAKLLPIQLQGAGVDGAFQVIISKEESKL